MIGLKVWSLFHSVVENLCWFLSRLWDGLKMQGSKYRRTVYWSSDWKKWGYGLGGSRNGDEGTEMKDNSGINLIRLGKYMRWRRGKEQGSNNEWFLVPVIGWIVSPPKFICWSFKPQYLRIWLYLEIEHLRKSLN